MAFSDYSIARCLPGSDMPDVYYNNAQGYLRPAKKISKAVLQLLTGRRFRLVQAWQEDTETKAQRSELER